MAKDDYMPREEQDIAALMERFRDNIGSFSTLLGLTPAEIGNQSEDASWFRYALNHTIRMKNAGSEWVAYKNLLLTGNDAQDGPANIPPTPSMPDPEPPSVNFGILTRFRELVRRIKASPNYNETVGEALGIIGPDAGEPDPATLIPEISLRTSGGQVEVVWKKGKMEAIEIQKDTGAGWQFLAMDTRPNYIDTTPFPAPPAMWKYRAIYTEDSQRMGQWSNVAEISVGA